MNSTVKLAIARTLSVTRIFPLLEKSLRSRGSLVFTLHRVLPLHELSDCYNPSLALTCESFDAAITFLKKRLPIVPVEELVQNAGKPNAAPVCALTFDDGWEDNYRVAYPILRAHSVPATIFIPTDMVGSCRLLPEERFCRVLLGARRAECLSLLKQQLIARGFLLSGHARGSLQELQSSFKKLDYAGKVEFLSAAEKLSNTAPPQKSSFFTWDQAREMQKHGVTFGSHTKRHTILSVNPLDFIQKELADSRQRIEQELGTKADLFAYPNGMHSPLAVRAVREAGYRAAFITKRAAVESRAHPFLLPRVPLSNDMVNTSDGSFSRAMAELLLIQTYLSKGESIVY